MYFVIYVPDAPPVDMPALIDPSGVYCFQEEIGNTYICGKNPTKVAFLFLYYPLFLSRSCLLFMP